MTKRMKLDESFRLECAVDFHSKIENYDKWRFQCVTRET